MKSFFDFPFLQKLDKHFLLNHRLLWITKIHYVLFYGLLTYGAAFLAVQLYPVSLTHEELPESGVFAFIAFLVALVPFILWVYKQVTYSIEDNYGVRFRGLELGKMLIYLFVVGLFMGVPVFTGVMLDTKIRNLITKNELQADIKKLNNGYYFINANRQNNREYNFYAPYVNTDNNLIQKEEFLYENHQIDTKYLRFCAYDHSLKLIQEYIATNAKYGVTIPFTALDIEKHYKSNKSIKTNYPNTFNRDSYKLRTKLRDIASSMTYDVWWNEKDFSLLSMMFWVMLANLLLIFKQTSIRALVFSVLAAMGLGFVSAVLGFLMYEVVGFKGDELLASLFGIFYVFFLVQAAGITRLNAFSRFKEISLVLVSLTTPFVPMYALIYADEVLGLIHSNFWQGLLSLIIGIIVYVLLALPIFKNWFVHLKAAPKA